MMLKNLRWAFIALLSLGLLQACGQTHQKQAGGSKLQLIADCTDPVACPQMISLPGGTFVMGSPRTEPGRFDDEDQHNVTLAPFAMQRAPVTKAQWARFVEETHRDTPKADCAYAPGDNPTWKDPGFPQTGNDPVVCITWGDAQAYAQWLSTRTGHHYRLPTDAEYEYAARAGSSTAYPWGDKASHANANYGMDECCAPLVSGADKWTYTSPVGSFPANAFGLVDMHGNVFEWVDTCADTFEKLPIPKGAKGCSYRYARGGAYGERPAMMRSAAKNLAPPPGEGTIETYRSAGFGFRLARDL